MARYISFELSQDDAQRSDFAHYSLGAVNLSPNYFGDLASTNIFLGENNSGKSRYMRAIMRLGAIRLFNLESTFKLSGLINDALININSLLPEGLFDLEINTQSQVSVEFLSIIDLDKKHVNGRNKITAKPSEDIPSLRDLLLLLQENTLNDKLLLDAAIGGRVEIDVREITGYLHSFNRVASIYKAFGTDKFRELGFSTHSVSSGYAHFMSTPASISFNAGEQSNEFCNKSYRHKTHYAIVDFVNRIIDSVKPILDLLLPISNEKLFSNSKVYIPTLRTARTLTDKNEKLVPAEDDVMRHTIIADYKLKDSSIEVVTGLSLYPSILKKILAYKPGRKEFDEFKKFLSGTFFDGKEVEVVPGYESNNILITIDGEERALPHLGDGIQSIILLLYPLFTARKGAWLFIEEPETHMHPGFQRLFIKTITTHPVLLEKQLTIFLTTHSNHLLDFAIDDSKHINLFTFKKLRGTVADNSTYQIQLTEHKDLSLLTELGVQNSSVFLSNCTIWVEGITDRIYLRAYLALYIEHLRNENRFFSFLEDLHYSFLEYAGANVAHYEFEASSPDGVISPSVLQKIKALPISNRILLIADKDSGKDTQHEARGSQQHAGFEYIVLEVREIENLLSPEVIVGTLQKMYPRKIFDVNLLNANRYKHNYIGRYLRKEFAELPASFVAKSGTLGSKIKRPFAEKASEVLVSWSQLTPEAKALTQRVFDFILGHNPRLGSN
jgi:hypothetical protein